MFALGCCLSTEKKWNFLTKYSRMLWKTFKSLSHRLGPPYRWGKGDKRIWRCESTAWWRTVHAPGPFAMECRAQAWLLFAPSKMSLAVYASLFFWIQDDGINLTFVLQLPGVTCMYSVHTSCHTAIVQFPNFICTLYLISSLHFHVGSSLLKSCTNFFKQCFQPSVKIYVVVSILSPFIWRKYLKWHQITKWKANPYIAKPKCIVRKHSEKEVTPDLQ